MRIAERTGGVRRGAAALCVGALAGAVMVSAYTSLLLVSHGDGGARLVFDGGRFASVLPTVLAGTTLLFLAAGPLVQRLRSVAGLDRWWGAALSGALVAFGFVRALAPELALDPHLSHTLIGAAAAVVADAWHARGRRCAGHHPRGPAERRHPG